MSWGIYRTLHRGVLLAAWIGLSGCEQRPVSETPKTRMSLIETLGGSDTIGYARAVAPRIFDFPLDHGSHPNFRTEWWYVTGNLSTEDEREFGFQFTIFRNALAPITPGGPSPWSTNQAYMGHFAVTDVDSGEFLTEENFARGAAGLAGVTSAPLRVWVEDWALEGAHREGTSPALGDEVFPLRLTAGGDGMTLNLFLEAGKPPVFQGDQGLSQKGPEPGNASFYYSHTRMPASGLLSLGTDTLEVSGLAWLDREWSTSALADGYVGWDWFALQLEDGWDMMVYSLRRSDGSAGSLSAGALIDPDGNRIELDWGSDLLLESTHTWASPIDGAVYPAGWRIQVLSRGWDLTIDPVIPDQELNLTFRYWEGAVRVRGTGESGGPVRGRGYVELTGYTALLGDR